MTDGVHPNRRSEMRKGLSLGAILLALLLGGGYFAFGRESVEPCREIEQEIELSPPHREAMTQWSQVTVAEPWACMVATQAGDGLETCKATLRTVEELAVPKVGDAEFAERVASTTQMCRDFISAHVEQLEIAANAPGEHVPDPATNGGLARSTRYLDVCVRLALRSADKAGIDVFDTHCKFDEG